ncbi:MAG: M20/M25/M40 family metallo-hydrolase [Pirellulaceae bacterium]
MAKRNRRRRDDRGKRIDLLEPNRKRAVRLVMQLMPIPGPSGRERSVADYIREQLYHAGVSSSSLQTDGAHRRALVQGDTGNLILKLPGTRRGPRRMLSAHMDTVPICVGCRPVRRGNRVSAADPSTGLGADDRAGCAVVLNTALEIVERSLPHPPLTFCWSIQEETGLHGARLVNKTMLANPRMVFNWDGGSAAKLTVGATGGYRLAIHVTGIASHAGSAPEQGVSAIAIAALAIADLHREGWHGNIWKDGKHGTSNVGYIRGGQATNVVTDRLQLKAEARSHDPRFRKHIVGEIEKAFARAAKTVRSEAGKCGAVKVEKRLDYESFLLSPDEPSLRIAEEAVRAIGRDPSRAVANGGLDANWWVGHGMPSVSFGCGQENQHMVSEALDIAEYEDACRIALRLATDREL